MSREVDRNRVKQYQANRDGCRSCGEPEGEKHAVGCDADVAQIGARRRHGEEHEPPKELWTCICSVCDRRFWTEEYPDPNRVTCPFCGANDIGFLPPSASPDVRKEAP